MYRYIQSCIYWKTEIFKECGEREWYFFTPRDKKYPNGSRPSRRAGNGYWKATGGDKDIRNDNDDVIAKRKVLVFYMGKPMKSGGKTNWIMHEYRLCNSPAPTRQGHNNMRVLYTYTYTYIFYVPTYFFFYLIE